MAFMSFAEPLMAVSRVPMLPGIEALIPPALRDDARALTCFKRNSSVRLPIDARNTAFNDTSSSEPLPESMVFERPTDMVPIPATNTGIRAQLNAVLSQAEKYCRVAGNIRKAKNSGPIMATKTEPTSAMMIAIVAATRNGIRPTRMHVYFMKYRSMEPAFHGNPLLLADS